MQTVAEEGENKRKRVRFNPHFEQVPPPQYPVVVDDTEPSLRSSAPAFTKSISSIKKRKFACVNAKGAEGQLFVGSGQAVFLCPSDEIHNWSEDLGNIVNFEAISDSSEALFQSLRFTMHDKTVAVFSRIHRSLDAFQTLLNDAETLGYVLVLDQPILPDNDASSMHLVDLFDDRSGKKKPEPLLGRFVSKGVHRFVNEQFNLDLTYVTKRMIVMAYPASGVKGFALNSAPFVKHFFDVRHPHAYMVYNLNTDRNFKYNPSKFEGRVRTFGFVEHGPPPLSLLLRLVADISAFLRQSPQHVVAIHCKMGKGRSGTVACAWMLHSRTAPSADAALAIFTRLRMLDSAGPGVRLPSQVRYVRYVEKIERDGLPPPNVASVTGVRCTTFPWKGSLAIQIKACDSSWATQFSPEKYSMTFESEPLELLEDIRIDASLDGVPIFTIHFNTRMLKGTNIMFHRDDMDGERDLKAFRLIPPEFSIVLQFSLRDSQQSFAPCSGPYPSANDHLPKNRSNHLVTPGSSCQTLDDPVSSANNSTGDEPHTEPVVVQHKSLRDLDPAQRQPKKIVRKPTAFIKRGTNGSQAKKDQANGVAETDADDWVTEPGHNGDGGDDGDGNGDANSVDDDRQQPADSEDLSHAQTAVDQE